MKNIFNLAFGILLLTLGSCDKGCYNPSIEKANEGVVCPTDCPGVIGCDGNSYCNECEANKLGVAVDN
jgi:hypothetical protein